MRIVTVDELISQKILPFDIFNGDGEIIFNAGEVLTPGKLLQLRYISAIYREDDEEIPEVEEVEETVDLDDLSIEDIVEKQEIQETEVEQESPPVIKKEAKEPEIEEKQSKEPKEETSTIDDFVNEDSYIRPKVQRDIKNLYKQAVESSKTGGFENNTNLYLEARDRIVEEIIPIIDDVIYKSHLKVYGNFDQSHGVNVAILSTILSCKLKLNDTQIRDISLAAMLHDIGKTRIPQGLFEKLAPTQKETKLMQLHCQIGYKILRKEMNLPEHIAKVALEHHERNDGSGYPYGISGDLISLPSQVVIVCDVYDTLTSGRGFVKVKNSKEAMRVMMEQGSKWFMPNVLYTFVHMSNYNDLTPVEN